MCCEYNLQEYLACFTKTKERIEAIDNLIDAMLAALALAIAGQAPVVSDYELDDGQVKVKTAYRSIDQVKAGIDALETLKQMYLNRLKGRVVNLRDVRGTR